MDAEASSIDKKITLFSFENEIQTPSQSVWLYQGEVKSMNASKNKQTFNENNNNLPNEQNILFYFLNKNKKKKKERKTKWKGEQSWNVRPTPKECDAPPHTHTRTHTYTHERAARTHTCTHAGTHAIYCWYTLYNLAYNYIVIKINRFVCRRSNKPRNS